MVRKVSEKIKIDLSNLYEIAERVDESVATLLAKILEHFNIRFKFIAVSNPDFPQTLIYAGDVRDVNKSIEDVVKDCNIVELFDGYETAVACID